MVTISVFGEAPGTSGIAQEGPDFRSLLSPLPTTLRHWSQRPYRCGHVFLLDSRGDSGDSIGIGRVVAEERVPDPPNVALK